MRMVVVAVLVLAVVGLAAAQCTLKCPDGYSTFTRTPTAANLKTSVWCVKPIFSAAPINVTTAQSLCAADSAVITTFENENERNQILFALQQVLTASKQPSGSIIIDGRRIPECSTADQAILNAEPCSDNTKAFAVSDKHTDPTFMFQHWADTEPSASAFKQDVESCLSLSISVYPKRNGGINDYLCNYAKAPQDENVVEFWNFGVLCGKLPEFQ